jgi:hypothetical protein
MRRRLSALCIVINRPPSMKILTRLAVDRRQYLLTTSVASRTPAPLNSCNS